MGVIRVSESGLFTTVQDLGREGFAFLGVSASGAADAISLRLGNRLLGNAEGAAGLEMTLLGGTFIFPEAATGALTGRRAGRFVDDVCGKTGADAAAGADVFRGAVLFVRARWHRGGAFSWKRINAYFEWAWRV